MQPTMRSIRSATVPARMYTSRNMFTPQRWYSSRPAAEPKEVSKHIGFYKVFTRPVAKVLLLATFTYQLVYWGWVKLETDEIKREKHLEVKELEDKLADLTRKTAAKP